MAFHPLKAPARQTDFSEPLPVKVKRWVGVEGTERVRIPERGSPLEGTTCRGRSIRPENPG